MLTQVVRSLHRDSAIDGYRSVAITKTKGPRCERFLLPWCGSRPQPRPRRVREHRSYSTAAGRAPVSCQGLGRRSVLEAFERVLRENEMHCKRCVFRRWRAQICGLWESGDCRRVFGRSWHLSPIHRVSSLCALTMACFTMAVAHLERCRREV